MISLKILVLTLLTNSTVTLGKAPPSLEWAPGLPPATVNPDGSVNVPPALAGELTRQLRYWREYPKLCQDSLDAQRASFEDELKVGEAKIEAEKNNRGVPLWVVIIGSMAGVMVGTYIGLDLGLHR